MKHRRPDPAALERQAAAFTQQYPIGTPVNRHGFIDRRDDPKPTVIRSAAWVMGGHSVMVLVDGFSGGQAVECIAAP